jgi:sulfate adenylyltransferase
MFSKDYENITPHGGCGLVNRSIRQREVNKLLDKVLGKEAVVLSAAEVSVFRKIADGTLSPLEGPMDSREFYKVLDDEVIERNGKKFAWTIPIAFPITKSSGERFGKRDLVLVKSENGVLLGALEISDVYYFDKQKYNRIVCGTDRLDHPACRIVNNDHRDYLVGGRIYAFPYCPDSVFKKYLYPPLQCREIFAKKKWERIAAFQTRNPLHRAHEYAMVYALEKLTREGYTAGVVLNPLVGETKGDDVPAAVRMQTYEALIREKLLGCGDKDEAFWQAKKIDFNSRVLLIALDMRMYYAGPKEAVMHAIYRQNMGFTDIIIGRRHADAPFDDGTQAWGDFEAQEKFNNLQGELLIRPLKVGTAAFFEEINRVSLEEEVKGKACHKVEIAGKELRRRLQAGESVDERIMRKPVADILGKYYARKTGE